MIERRTAFILDAGAHLSPALSLGKVVIRTALSFLIKLAQLASRFRVLNDHARISEQAVR
jgi:hypothetical protein